MTQEVGGVESDAHDGGARHAEQRADAEADAAADPLHQQRRRKHPDHHAEMLHRDRQVGEIGTVIEGDDRKARRRKHHGVAGLADRLAAGRAAGDCGGCAGRGPGSGSASGLSPDWGFSASIIVLAQSLSGRRATQGRTGRALTLSRKSDLRLKAKEEYFCCLGLRERHNSLSGIDGPIKSRKLAMMFRPGRRPESMRLDGGGRRWPMI